MLRPLKKVISNVMKIWVYLSFSVSVICYESDFAKYNITGLSSQAGITTDLSNPVVIPCFLALILITFEIH